MLNPFPELLVYGILAPFIIRVALGSALLYLGIEHYRGRVAIAELLNPLMGKLARGAGGGLGLIEVLCGVALIVGAWTQVAALLACALTLKPLLLRAHLRGLSPYSPGMYMLLFVMALSLLVSGAGAFAFDIPL